MTEGYRNECFTCSHVDHCPSTDVWKTLDGYVCPLFAPIPQPVVQARIAVVMKYGPIPAARALLKQPSDPDAKEEFPDMGAFDQPAPGTTYSERKKQLEVMTFMDVRVIGAKKYKGPDGAPILDWDETLKVDRKEESISKVLDFELANNIIVPDAAAAQYTTQPQGVQMAQNPYTPPGAPPNGAPMQTMPQQPMPSAPPPPPNMQPPPPPPGASPYGMAPQVPPGVAPPVATPQQAAQPVEAAPTQGKKKKGAAAAPPPPPPPSNPVPGGPPAGFQQVPMQPAPGWQPAPVMAAPPMVAAPQPTWQQPPPVAPPQAMGADLTPVLQLVDQVGKAVNGLGAVQDEKMKALAGALESMKTLLLVQVAALHHIYLGQPHLAQSLQNKDVGDINKFIAYMQGFLPR